MRQHRCGLTLAQAMAHCLPAQSHILNQILTNHQWGSVAFIWWTFTGNAQDTDTQKSKQVEILHYLNYHHISWAPIWIWVKQIHIFFPASHPPCPWWADQIQEYRSPHCCRPLVSGTQSSSCWPGNRSCSHIIPWWCPSARNPAAMSAGRETGGEWDGEVGYRPISKIL